MTNDGKVSCAMKEMLCSVPHSTRFPVLGVQQQENDVTCEPMTLGFYFVQRGKILASKSYLAVLLLSTQMFVILSTV